MPTFTKSFDISEAVSELIDTALVAKTKTEYAASRGSGVGEVAAKRIGAGYIGLDCGRALAYKYHKAPIEEREVVYVKSGELQRHAEAGHWTEEKTADWMRLAGFGIDTYKKDQYGQPILMGNGKPKQIGWLAARDPKSGQFRMAGEVDGLIHGVPAPLVNIIATPCFWESKKATDKKWKKFKKEKVKGADPKYYGQLQTNMAYMGVSQTLFSMLNLDNMQYYFELVPFDQSTAQRLTDRAVRVLESSTPEEMPRIGNEETDYRCKFCDYAKLCWSGRTLAQSQATQAREFVKSCQDFTVPVELPPQQQAVTIPPQGAPVSPAAKHPYTFAPSWLPPKA